MHVHMCTHTHIHTPLSMPDIHFTDQSLREDEQLNGMTAAIRIQTYAGLTQGGPGMHDV